jgi:hypothetical protein
VNNLDKTVESASGVAEPSYGGRGLAEHGVQYSPLKLGRLTGFLNAYCRHQLAVRLHFCYGGLGSDNREYCAVVYRPYLEELDPVTWKRLRRYEGEFLRQATNQVQEAVLVSVAQLLKEPQGMEFFGALPLGVAVRLQGIEYCQCSVRNTPQLFRDRRSVLIGIDEDRELVSPVGHLVVRENKLPNEVIQGGPEVVEEFSQQEAPTQGYVLMGDDYGGVFGAISIRIKPKSVRVAQLESIKLGIQGPQMFLRSVQLQTNPRKSKPHD